MEWCETIWRKWVDGKEMGKPAMDGRTIKEIQCSATPLRGLRQRQSKSPWTSMRWSRLGQCRSNLEVWQHLERSAYIGWNDPRELRSSCWEVEQFPESDLHRVQANEKNPSSSARTQSHKRWVGIHHGQFRWWIDQKTWTTHAEVGDRQCRSRDMAMACCNPSPYGTFESPRRCAHRRQQDFLPDEPRSGLYSWRRISLHYIWEHRPNFPRRTTSRRRRRPHQYVLRAIRTVGRAKSNGVAIQEDWSNWSCIHLHHVWIHRQVLPSNISRRTHLGPRDNSFRLIWCCMVLWLEGRKVLPSHDHKRKRPDCTFCARSKEDCHHRTIWQAHWEHCSWWIFTRPERTPKACRHQDQSHQSFSQDISWTSGLEWCNLAFSSHSSSEQRRS